MQVELREGPIAIQSETYFLDDLDEIAKIMSEKEEDGKLKGRTKTAADILIEFLEFYGTGQYASSNNRNMICISPKEKYFISQSGNFFEYFDSKKCDQTKWNRYQYVIRDPFNNTYNPAKAENVGDVDYRVEFKKALKKLDQLKDFIV